MGIVVPAQSRTRGKSGFFTPKRYPVLAGVNLLVPADSQVVPTLILTICSANFLILLNIMSLDIAIICKNDI